MSIDLSTFISLVAALGVGSLIVQWYGAGKDRRTARGGVLKALSAVESARWYSSDRDTHRELVDAIRELETAALIARVPRPFVRAYAQLAVAASWASRNNAEQHGGDEEGSGISLDLSDVVLEAADLVSRAAWSSRLMRYAWLRRQLRILRRHIDELARPDDRAAIESARRRIR